MVRSEGLQGLPLSVQARICNARFNLPFLSYAQVTIRREINAEGFHILSLALLALGTASYLLERRTLQPWSFETKVSSTGSYWMLSPQPEALFWRMQSFVEVGPWMLYSPLVLYSPSVCRVRLYVSKLHSFLPPARWVFPIALQKLLKT